MSGYAGSPDLIASPNVQSTLGNRFSHVLPDEATSQSLFAESSTCFPVLKQENSLIQRRSSLLIDLVVSHICYFSAFGLIM